MGSLVSIHVCASRKGNVAVIKFFNFASIINKMYSINYVFVKMRWATNNNITYKVYIGKLDLLFKNLT